jgi:hypothetical protein
VFCGPLGRWLIGALLGFRILKTTRDPANSFPGQVVEQPHLRTAVLAAISVFIIFMCMVGDLCCVSRTLGAYDAGSCFRVCKKHSPRHNNSGDATT